MTMRAIEVFGEVSKDGNIRLSHPLPVEVKRVKVIILIPEENELDDNLWLKSVNNSEAFKFLLDEKEDVYTPEDGKPFRHEI